MKRIAKLPILLCVLSGCATALEAFNSQTPPSTELRSALVIAARDYLVDPYSVRDAEISAVLIADAKKGLQSVCVKANAKNSMGGYSGRTTLLVTILNGNLNGSFRDNPTCFDQRLIYYPFPELEALKNT